MGKYGKMKTRDKRRDGQRDVKGEQVSGRIISGVNRGDAVIKDDGEDDKMKGKWRRLRIHETGMTKHHMNGLTSNKEKVWKIKRKEYIKQNKTDNYNE